MASPITLLQLSPTMEQGTVVNWLVSEGDDVESGQAVAEVETDKAVMEQESFEDGKVLKIVANEGDKVDVGDLLMVIGEEGEDISDVLEQGGQKEEKKEEKKEPEKEEKKDKDKKEEKPKAEEVAPARPEPAASGGRSGRILASPLARKMAEEEGLDLSQIEGSGPKGRIVKRDIEKVMEEGTGKKPSEAEKPAKTGKAAAPAPAPRPASVMPSGEAEEEIKLSGMRETIARRLSQSKQTVPHFQLHIEVRGENLEEAVARAREAYPDTKVTVTHFIVKAMANAAMRHQPIRTQWAEDKLVVMPHASISVAVAIDEGLVTPVIRNAHGKGVVQIAQELRELAGLARDRKLGSEDYSGGVQTLSNLGMYDITRFNAIINPPESSILAVGSLEERPVVENGQVVPGKVMEVVMSCDHRVIDGMVGAQYLADLKRSLEEPMLILM